MGVPALESMGNRREEEGRLQLCRPRYLLSWPVLTILK